MSVLVVGLSHKSASLGTLERAVVSGDALGKLLRDVSQAPNVAGAFVVSTCNRVEVYAEVDKFHGGVSSICDLLARHSGIPLGELTPHLYVHYEDRAVQHLLAVACGLDSMVVGESQILGQVRQALGIAREQGTLEPCPGRPGRARAAHRQAGAHRDRDRPGGREPGQRRHRAAARPAAERPAASRRTALAAAGRVLVVGAGSMSSLAATTAARMGAARIVVANRTRTRPGGWPRPWPAAPAELAEPGRPAGRRRPGHLLHRRRRAW